MLKFPKRSRTLPRILPSSEETGIERCRKITKLVKESGLKVQAQIMDDLIRVSGKKLDDLQAVIRLCEGAGLGIPLQFVNMRS